MDEQGVGYVPIHFISARALTPLPKIYFPHTQHDAASMMARCLLDCGHASHAAAVMMRMGSCHAEGVAKLPFLLCVVHYADIHCTLLSHPTHLLPAVWRKIFRASLATMVEEGGQDALLQAIYDFQSQIRMLDAVFDRGVLTALLNQEAALFGSGSSQMHHPSQSYVSYVDSKCDNEYSAISSEGSSATDIGSTCDTLTLTAALNSFPVSSSAQLPLPPPLSSASGAASRVKRSKGSTAFAVDAARTLQSKLAAAALHNSPDEASLVHARAVWLMRLPSSGPVDKFLSTNTDKLPAAAHRSEVSCLSPALMRDVVRLCALACDTGERRQHCSRLCVVNVGCSNWHQSCDPRNGSSCALAPTAAS